MLGPGDNVAGQGHRVAAGVHLHVAVVGDQRVAVESVLDEQGDINRVRVVGDLDLVLDFADTDQPGYGQFGAQEIPVMGARESWTGHCFSSSDFAGLKDVDRFGELSSPPRAAAEFAQDAPGFELCVGAFAWAA